MTDFTPAAPYDLILGACGKSDAEITALNIGLTWTTCRSRDALGFAMSPGTATRVLPWPGTVAGRPLSEVAAWLTSWNTYEATVGLAAANAAINTAENVVLQNALPLTTGTAGNLAVFDYFLPRLQGRKVVVIGRYPGLERVLEGLDVSVLERDPTPADLPGPSAEFVLPEADWVFLTATSLINKTFPRLAELARNAVTVLMGPSMPWLAEWTDFGIDFLAGVRVVDAGKAEQIAAEGGGTRLFGEGVRYAIADIGLGRMQATRTAIATLFSRRDALKAEMEAWYSGGRTRHFPKRAELETIDAELSQLDSRYKRLWDARK
jgi:uncharacterized protein (DUF4213/DUF364 family)